MESSILIFSQNELPAAVVWLEEWLKTTSANVVALYGGMGAGKTTFVSEFARQRSAAHKASSPTFAIVNAYDLAGGNHIYHFDFYRIESIREAQDIGFFDYTDSGAICFVEWPERVEALLSEVDLIKIGIEVDPATDARKFFII